jgi:two-component system cell cycle response regulator
MTGQAEPVPGLARDVRDIATPRTLPFVPTEDVAFSPGEANVLVLAHPAGKLLGQRFRLRRGTDITIGRSATADISLPDVPSISRTHARLRFGDGVTIADLGSTNGTVVDGKVAEGETPLRSGSRFQVGAVHFKLLLEHDVEHAYHLAVYDLMMRDGLTQLFNRRKLDEEAERECARTVRYGRPLSLVLFDIDHFKQVNDAYGHLRGDDVLQRLAAAARGMTRTEQLLCRSGGEEFAILCPEVQAEGAAMLAERLRRAVAGLEHVDGGSRFHVTCSFGVAGWGGGMTRFAELFEAADRALYCSKQKGRNQVTIASAR